MVPLEQKDSWKSFSLVRLLVWISFLNVVFDQALKSRRRFRGDETFL